MNKKIGFIGCGNMGESILRGIISHFNNNDKIIVSTKTKGKMENLKKQYGVTISPNLEDIIKNSDIIFLGVKPNIINDILGDIKSSLTSDKIIISMAAGVTISQIENILGDESKIVRIMPNTPASIGLSMTSMTPNNNLNLDEISLIEEILNGFGEVEVVSEELIHSVIGVSGSSPAYVFMFIEAMADAAVLGGMPREKAYKFASQSVLGAAKLVLESGKHPGVLKDMVCSPGGTTIEAVSELEKTGFRASIISSISKCIEKSQKMSKE